jgi:hypothetical protein
MVLFKSVKEDLECLDETDSLLAPISNFLLATLAVDLDEGSFHNTINHPREETVACSSEEQEEANVSGGCDLNHFAKRDTKAGEELIIDYGVFEPRLRIEITLHWHQVP